jgi:integrase
MPTMKMTKAKIRDLRAPDPSGRQQLYWAEGTETPGLGILVSGTTATKSWVVQGKLKGGQTRRVTLGKLSVLSLEEAWEAARPKLADLQANVDPKAPKRKAATVREALDQYLKNPRLAPKSRADYRGRVERHLAPWLDLPIASINPNMVEARFHAIADEVEARRAAGGSRGGVNVSGRASANGALSIFRSLFRDQQKRDPEMPARDPTVLLSRQWHDLPRRKRLVREDEMPAFWAGVQGLESRDLRDLLTFTLFTGLREMEASALRWSEVDLRERIIRIPASRMKARKDFELPMSRQLADLLIARRALGREGSFVWPGLGKTGHTQGMTFALRKVAEATGIVTSPHDLRRTYVTIASQCPIPPVSLKLLVAHSAGTDVTSGYVVLTTEQLRAAAQTVADRIAERCSIAPVEGVNVKVIA